MRDVPRPEPLAAREDRRSQAFVLLAASVLFWGGSWRAVAIATDYASPLMISALRAGMAAVVLVVVLAIGGSRLLQRELWIGAAVTGPLVVALALYGQTESVERAGVGMAAVLGTTTPFFVFLLGLLFLGRELSILGLTGLTIGFTGVVLVIFSAVGVGQATDLTLGAAFALASAAVFALGTLVVKRLVERDPDLDLPGLVAGQYVVGAVLLFLFLFATDSTGRTAWSSGQLWGALAWLGLGASAFALVAFFAAVKRLDATRASAWIFLVPVIAVLIEITRGVVPGPVAAVGIVFAISGVALTSIAPERERRRGRASMLSGFERAVGITRAGDR